MFALMNSPRVLLTFAQSIDGRIAAASGESRYISRSGSLALSQELRRDHDAIMVGIATVLRDDPALTCRIASGKNPLRVVLDSSLRLPLDSQLAQSAQEVPTLVYCTKEAASGPAAAALKRRGVIVKEIATGEDGRPDLEAVLMTLSGQGIGSLMVEGGSAVLTAFVQRRLWHRMLVVTAPLILGRGVEALGDIGVVALADACRPEVKEIRIIGSEVVWDLLPGLPPEKEE
jgi:riboflavin-specific deaminase-like protein